MGHSPSTAANSPEGIDPPGTLAPLAADEATTWLQQVNPERLVQPGRYCQRQLPKSSVDMLNKGFLDLAGVATDLRLHANQREMAWTLFFLAPAILWPKPPRTATPRPARARPQLVKQRLQRLRRGEWINLIDDLQVPADRPPHEPAAPGMVTEANARAWLSEASRGGAAHAWRKLQSWGIAPNIAETCAQVEAEWNSQPQHSLPPWKLPRVEVLDSMTSTARLAQAQGHYQKCRASDAHGWSPLVFKQLLGQSQAAMPLSPH